MLVLYCVCPLEKTLLYFSSCYLSQVASLLHDDVLDDADTRRGVSSLNLVMGNKVL
jgi:geranylgeranyl pyrophosphate synthase